VKCRNRIQSALDKVDPNDHEATMLQMKEKLAKYIDANYKNQKLIGNENLIELGFQLELQRDLAVQKISELQNNAATNARAAISGNACQYECSAKGTSIKIL
jgi:hypothetical protein